MKQDILHKGIDYRDHRILAVSKYLNSVDWSILVKIDEEEAFTAIAEAKKLISFVSIALILLSALVAYILSRIVTKPIKYLTAVTQKISKGD